MSAPKEVWVVVDATGDTREMWGKSEHAEMAAADMDFEFVLRAPHTVHRYVLAAPSAEPGEPKP